jgi:hypothetical protein
MKIFTTVICILISVFVNGQCVPDTSVTHNVPGNYPSTLPHALTGVPYQTVIQVKVLTDTLTLVVDSITIDNVSGLPTGFAYTCTPASCHFPAGSDACVSITGSAPSVSMVGSYPIVVNTTVYGKVGGFPYNQGQDFTNYEIVIDLNTATGILDKNTFTVGQTMPNPARNFAVLPVTTGHPDVISISITNLIGKNVFSNTVSLQKGKTNIPLDLHSMDPGIYIYSVSNGESTITRRLIIPND